MQPTTKCHLIITGSCTRTGLMACFNQRAVLWCILSTTPSLSKSPFIQKNVLRFQQTDRLPLCVTRSAQMTRLEHQPSLSLYVFYIAWVSKQAWNHLRICMIRPRANPLLNKLPLAKKSGWHATSTACSVVQPVAAAAANAELHLTQSFILPTN